MKPAYALAALALLAAVQAAVWFTTSQSTSTPATETPAPTISGGSEPAPPAGTPQKSNTAPNTPRIPPFRWSTLDAADFKGFIANLRSIHCPETTIRDIIVAEVNRLYAPREAPFKAPPEIVKAPFPWEKTPPTLANAETNAAKRDFERRKQLREIEREKAAVVKDLLNVDLPLDPLRSWSSRTYDRVESAINALPADKRERVRELQELYWQASDTLSEKHNKNRGKEYQAEYMALNAQRREMLGQILTPEELEDYEMRSSSALNKLATQVADLKLSDEEFRSIYQARKPVDEPFGGVLRGDQSNRLDAQERTARETAAQESIKSVLGDDRYAQFQRNSDPFWQNLTKLQGRFGIEQEKLEEAFKSYEQLKNQITLTTSRATPDMPPDQLAQLRESYTSQMAQAKSQFTGLLGDKAMSIMEARGPGYFNWPSFPDEGKPVRNVIRTEPVITPPSPAPKIVQPAPAPAP